VIWSFQAGVPIADLSAFDFEFVSHRHQNRTNVEIAALARICNNFGS
jgi:hypothetical protein